MFSINVTYKAKDKDTLRRFYDDLTAEKIEEVTRTEDGCLLYEFYFSAERDNELLLVEKWVDRASQERHDMKSHMQKLTEIKERLGIETSIEEV